MTHSRWIFFDWPHTAGVFFAERTRKYVQTDMTGPVGDLRECFSKRSSEQSQYAQAMCLHTLATKFSDSLVPIHIKLLPTSYGVVI